MGRIIDLAGETPHAGGACLTRMPFCDNNISIDESFFVGDVGGWCLE